MKQEELVVGLDLGSSKLIAMAARKNEHGVLSILDAQKMKTENCIRRGCVHNIEDTTNKVKRLLTEFNKEGQAFDKIYVGINGQSLHSHLHIVTREKGEEIVTQKLLDLLLEECRLFSPEKEGLDILDIVSLPEYILDGQVEKNPVGVRCSKIEARFQLIRGKLALKNDLKEIIEKEANMPIAGYFISPLATAEAVLTEEQKKLGCALVELGGGVTTVSVYTNGFLRYLITIPLGGDVITKDLQNMNVLEEEAETLKKDGYLDGLELDSEKIELIISTRSEEIIENVIEQIKESGYFNELNEGIFITGGSASLNDLSEFLKEKTKLPVLLVSAKRSLVNQASDLSGDPANSTVIGLLALGKGDCAVPQIEEEKPKAPGELFGEDEIGIKNGENNRGKTEFRGGRSPRPNPFGGFIKRLFDDE